MEEILNIKKQLKISMPIATENFINILMTLVDTLVIATLGTNELGAIGAMAVVLNIMQMSIEAINVSNMALLAKSQGEKNQKQVKLLTGNAVMITILIAMAMIFVVYGIRPIFPSLFQVDKVCITYMTIRLIGFLQSSVVTILTGHQRTIGKQGNIMVIRIIAVIGNLLLDLLVVTLHYGVAGVAWVTVGIDTILSMYLMIKSKSTVTYQFQKSITKEIFELFKWNCVERMVSKIDEFVFNILVSRIGSLEYAVHVILIQIADVSQAFVQGFSNGISISIGIETGYQNKERMKMAKQVIRKVINIFSVIVPVMVTTIAIVIAHLFLKQHELLVIFYSVLPLLVMGQYAEMSGTYYYGILRGMREFKFLAKRNFMTSIIKIVVATTLSYTMLGIIGVWIAYAVYCLVQKWVSKYKYKILEKGEI